MSDMKSVVAAMQDAAPNAPVRLRQGVVQSVETGTVTVTVGGSSIPLSGISYLSSYLPTAGDTVWLATDGRDWLIIGSQTGSSGSGGGGGAAVVVADTAPTAAAGALWIRSTDMTLFVRFNDGDSTQWVEVRKTEDAAPAAYRYVETLYYTTNGTFTKADYPWLRAIRVKVQGGGGAGGGAPATAAGQTSVGGGGGGGAYSESFITDIAGLDASITVTRGAGGTAVSGASGNAGGSSSFGTLVVADGGGGGTARASSAFYIPSPGGDGGNPALGTGDLKIGGTGGSMGWKGANYSGGGGGGASHLGGGAHGNANGSGGGSALAGTAGLLYGGGGSGGATAVSSSAAAGGAGAAGVVIVELYA